ncbi:hypothetical protein BHE74_00017901 [Ensete ventricosum]|uniref:Uncharacterized protein n=1 Tax=Ensete ventricosum TaxID=4639 RepID=A0A444CDC7_ENSVE|nr:hypothetical protein B296_00039281 [Ensete ventricosum]RWV83883.1 hypothetical protein GW17_00054446 [Ensete ventricosum]RWW74174.1 hypothetical protein BHE74_00017901 [Ensete ventricosum]RZS08876.1 hypothetical protein BHM03_00039908 [Ensete ventricosum]
MLLRTERERYWLLDAHLALQLIPSKLKDWHFLKDSKELKRRCAGARFAVCPYSVPWYHGVVFYDISQLAREVNVTLEPSREINLTGKVKRSKELSMLTTFIVFLVIFGCGDAVDTLFSKEWINMVVDSSKEGTENRSIRRQWRKERAATTNETAKKRGRQRWQQIKGRVSLRVCLARGKGVGLGYICWFD